MLVDESSYQEDRELAELAEAIDIDLSADVRLLYRAIRKSEERILITMEHDRQALDAAIRATGDRVKELVDSLEEKINESAAEPEDFSEEIAGLNAIATTMQSGTPITPDSGTTAQPAAGGDVAGAGAGQTAVPSSDTGTANPPVGGAQDPGSGQPGANPSAGTPGGAQDTGGQTDPSAAPV